MTHGRHTLKIASDIAMATLCACIYTSSKYALTQWKCFLRCCEKCSCIDLPSTKSDQKNSNVSPKISFHVYHLIARCTVHVIHL